MGDDGWWDDPQWRTSSVRLDDEALKGLAHPLRLQLLTLLRSAGPSTSTRLAAALGTDTGATSYHLRQLQRYGFVADVPGRGNRRERWWRALHRQTTWSSSEVSAAPEVRAAETVVEKRQLEHEVAVVRRWLGARHTYPAAWRAGTEASDYLLRLLPHEAGALGDELRAVVERHRDAAEESPASRDDRATGAEELVLVVLRMVPQAPGPAT